MNTTENNNNLTSYNFFFEKVKNKKPLSRYANSVTLIFPFYWSYQHKDSNSNTKSSEIGNFTTWRNGNFLNGTTKIYKYIMDRINTIDVTKANSFVGEFERDLLEEDMNKLYPDKNVNAYSKFKYEIFTIENLRLFVFDNNIGFCCLPYILNKSKSVESKSVEGISVTEMDLFYALRDIKIFIRDSDKLREYMLNNIRDFLNTYYKVSTKKLSISFFDDPNILKSPRCSILSSFYLKSTTKKQDVSVNDFNIPFWYSGLMPLKNDKNNPNFYCGQYKYRQTQLKKSFSIASYNIISSTVEGCCSCNYIDIKNNDIRTYAEKNLWKHYQHMYIEYMLLLMQYYSLHKITMESAKVTEINERYKKIKHIRKVEKSYTDFRNSFMFNKISTEDKVQELYEVMRENMGIESFAEEALYSIEPLKQYYENTVDRIRNTILLTLSGISLVNTILAISTFELTLNFNKKWIIYLVCGIVSVASILLSVVLSFIRRRTSNKINQKKP